MKFKFFIFGVLSLLILIISSMYILGSAQSRVSAQVPTATPTPLVCPLPIHGIGSVYAEYLSLGTIRINWIGANESYTRGYRLFLITNYDPNLGSPPPTGQHYIIWNILENRLATDAFVDPGNLSNPANWVPSSSSYNFDTYISHIGPGAYYYDWLLPVCSPTNAPPCIDGEGQVVGNRTYYRFLAYAFSADSNNNLCNSNQAAMPLAPTYTPTPTATPTSTPTPTPNCPNCPTVGNINHTLVRRINGSFNINLSWTSIPNADNYQIWRCSYYTGSCTLGFINSTTSTSFSDDGGPNGSGGSGFFQGLTVVYDVRPASSDPFCTIPDCTDYLLTIPVDTPTPTPNVQNTPTTSPLFVPYCPR